MRFPPPLLAASLCAVLAACGSPDAVEVSRNDHELTFAMIQARESSHRFIDALRNPPPSMTFFAVKRRFTDGDKTDYLWLTELRWENGQIIGTLANEPQYVENVRKGGEYAVMPDEICDWLIIENGRRIGGYTDAVLQKRREKEAK